MRVDRTRKLPATVLLRAFGIVGDNEIIEVLGETEQVLNTLEKDNTATEEEALLEIYKRLRPGEPPTVDSASSMINNMFFDYRRYDLAKVGRYKFNKKLFLSCTEGADKLSAFAVLSDYDYRSFYSFNSLDCTFNFSKLYTKASDFNLEVTSSYIDDISVFTPIGVVACSVQLTFTEGIVDKPFCGLLGAVKIAC